MRRLHVARLQLGEVPLDPGQSRHARKALRLSEGESVEVFDDFGKVGLGKLVFVGADDSAVQITEIRQPVVTAVPRVSIASAVPKGERADWLIEKLSELGVARFVPLRTQRSVVHPRGSKPERWLRIATESAKQSRRIGMMEIAPLQPLDDLLQHVDSSKVIVLSTSRQAWPLPELLRELISQELLLLIGPEGGWSDRELQNFTSRALRQAKLTETVLRVETAAVTAAALALLCHR